MKSMSLSCTDLSPLAFHTSTHTTTTTGGTEPAVKHMEQAPLSCLLGSKFKSK